MKIKIAVIKYGLIFGVFYENYRSIHYKAFAIYLGPILIVVTETL